MKITIICDNEAAVEGLKGDWGFASLVEAHGVRTLFDTGARDVVRVEAPVEIHGGVYSTGELGGFEQSLLVDSGAGIVVVAGCSHPGVGSILDGASRRGRPRALLGGLHGESDFALLADLEIVCPTHCTRHRSEIRDLYPDKYVAGGVGAAIGV